MEQLNLGNEAVKSSRRRLSSILKAPRASMKLLGVEQEEEKEEVPKPVEKKRNSRRVSFASTNNVRVFTNDAKNESPVLTSIQNTLVEDRRDEKILHFVDEGSYKIKGLETLLNTPLYLSQHKENFFSDPVLQDDCVDRTMLLGEDTGYMDATHCHTISIDKDYEIEEDANPDFSFKVAQTVCGDQNISSQKGLHEAKAEKKNAAMDSDFSSFLGSMSLPTVATVKPQKSEKELDTIFCPANASTLEVDKENHLASFLMKQSGNPKQPLGLQRRRSRVSFVADDRKEPTTSHTVVIESKDNAQPLTTSISENPRSVAFMTSAFSNFSDDMELTQSQTAAINGKVTGNITCNVQDALDYNKSRYFPEDDNAMEMTGAFDASVQEKGSVKEQVQTSVPKIRRMSSLNVIENAETMDQAKAGYFQCNLSVVQTASSDDIEETVVLDGSIQKKEEALFPKVSRISTFGAIGNEDGNKSISTFMPSAANSDDMDMTQCQNMVLEDKPSSGNKSLSISRKSLPLSSVSRTVQEDEHAEIIKQDRHPIPRENKMSRSNVIRNSMMMEDTLSMVQTAGSDEMEITQCQTIFLEDKPSSGNKSLSNSRKSLPLSSVSRTVQEDEHAEMIKQGRHPIPSVNKMSSFNVISNSVIVNDNKSGNFSMVQMANSDEMEITQCQTIFLEDKPTSGKKPLSNLRKSLPLSSASRTVQEDEHSEIIKQDLHPIPSVNEMSTFNVIRNSVMMNDNKSGNFSMVQMPNSDEMEITQCQTIFLEDKPTSGKKPLSNSRKSLPLASVSRTVQEDEHAEIIKQDLHPMPSVNKMSSFNFVRNSVMRDDNKTGTLSGVQRADSDEMEITQCQTIFLEDKPTSGKKPLSNSRKSLPLSSVSRTVQEDEHAEIKKQDLHPIPSVNKMSTFNVIRNSVMMDDNKSGNFSMVQMANSDEMEITQCQTIFLEDKPTIGNKSFSNSRKSLPLASVSRTVREHDHTGNVKEEALHPISRENMMPSYNLAESRVMMGHNKSGHATIVQTADFDEMEFTQCQTICLDAEPVSGDKPFSNSRTNVPYTSVSRTEDRDEMDMTQVVTGHTLLYPLSASKKETGESVLIPASVTRSQHNESDCMDLTCQPSTSAWISPPSPDEMKPAGCNTININQNRTWFGSAVDTTGRTRAPSFANQTITVVDPMEMTAVHTAQFSDLKHKAFMTRRKSGARMVSLMCNPDNTEADNCQTDFSSPADMDVTQCQTVVLEAENCKKATPFNKSRKSLNIVSTSSSPDVDGMEITQALTGNIVGKSFASKEERKNERTLLPTAQRCQMQYESDCMELTGQASASNLAIPCVDDEMGLTGCNTIAIDSKRTLAASAGEIKVNENALWASTSVSRCTVSSEEQNEVSEAAKYAIHHAFPSKHVFNLDGKNLKRNNAEKMSYDLADIQVDKNCEMAHPSNVVVTDEDDEMQVTKALTMAIEVEQSVSFNQRDEANIKSSCGSKIETDEQSLKEHGTNSAQLEGSSSAESVADSFIKEEMLNAKARRRSLADFQMELHNMSRRIQDEQNGMMGSKTAPLPSCSLPEISHEREISAEPTSNVTPNVKEKNHSLQNEKTTPFSLKKKPFSSRLSLCGVVPKLPKRATTTPNKTVTISTNDLQCFQLEKHFDAVEQKSSYETVNINDEELPEMSSEEDLSGSLENWPINNQDGCTKEDPFEDDVFESGTNMNPCFKRPHPDEDPITAEQTKKACVSDMGPDCHEAAVQWEGNFTRHAAQNPKAKTIEDTGVSECSFRYSQFDSHMDGTLDHEFDFNKKLEDGTITVNEFLNHLGINFVIHRSRPSALPVNCRAGETRTMEDLLKEKYIYHPRQRVYEQDCKNLTEMVERLKEEMPKQEKPLGNLNGALQQEICTVSKEQLKSFGAKLKEQRVYFGKRSKARSHEMKGLLYSELIKTTQGAKQSLISKIKETNEMMEDLDRYINELETELASVEDMLIGDHLDAPQTEPALKAKENDLRRLNSAVTEKEREIGELETELRTLEGQQERLRGESSSLKSHLETLNSLNEWRLDETDERGALFTFLHRTVHLQVNLQTPAGKDWMTEDVERNIDVSFQLQLDGENSACHASMVHKLIALHHQSQTQWTQRYPTTRHIPKLLFDISLVVGRLRLLGEEIHRLKKWGGLKLRILKITCVETRVHIIFSSLKAFEKFELSLMVTPDYPFGPLHVQDFKNHMGNTRLSQIEDIVSSVRPEKNYLTKVLKKIYDDLLC